ncbi:MAG: flagellar biosynthesis anti-sigma factor FlgM [Fervidobacterium sp.]|uniref:Negative regulator of flagellin synthesis n=1 Tax=Fervidobacterium gondwanense DSM 13020 TaxID=1121883 RepID=A0A1M7RXT7_FERGO|nr:flagellar biosynthesis anti-sigma factor FlgM [Fervidobacterium gondwanense]UXF00106.1 flagellar biosynthesis anti-sigma factor FlgM [Fervidobacterium riparium]SHN51129.1 anti-sigma-28 factor, FlgM family [Fervidobacterium gondwanense DSM 13020]
MIDKINKLGVQGMQNLQEVKGKTEKDVEKSKVRKEDLKVSDQLIVEEGKRVAEYIEMAKTSSEVRTELVEQIKKAIEDGTFKVDVEKIAKKILEG